MEVASLPHDNPTGAPFVAYRILGTAIAAADQTIMTLSFKTSLFSGALLLSWSACVQAAPFGNTLDSAWADTPQGKFVCRDSEDTNNLQVLTLGGKVVFQEQPNPDGIENRDVGCPTILANERGYVVLVRDTAPPHYGIHGYAVIDFNKKAPALIPFANGQDPRDSDIPDKRRLQWSDKGITLHYFGYAPGVEGGSVDTPKPHADTLFFDFASETVQTVQ